MTNTDPKSRMITVTYTETDEFPGTWFRATSVSVNDYLEFDESYNKLIAGWAQNLTEWNLKDGDGNKLDINVENIMASDITMIRSLAFAWMRAMARIVRPNSPKASMTDLATLAESI